MYQIDLEKVARNQIRSLAKNKKLLAKILEMIDDISTDPYSPKYKFERLKHNLAGYCSKRLDQKNRIIYKVQDNQIIITVISVLGHYEDN